jgi:hypothetical protein
MIEIYDDDDDDTLLLLSSTITSTLFGLEMNIQCKHGTNVYGFYVHVTASSRGESNRNAG